MSAAPLWVTKINDLVREAVDQVPDHGRQTRRLAEAHPDPELGPGWFVVPDRLTPAQAEHAADGYLRHGIAPSAREYDVLEVVVSGEAVRVRTSISAPQTGLDLYVPTADQRRILTGLADGLAALRDSPLLATLAQRKLTPIPDDEDLGSVHGWDEFRPAQKRAVAACCAAGLHLVWGPPRTGKTRVIAAAVSRLAGTGRRVLLVSATDIAVDAAAYQAVQIMRPGSGDVLRVGAIHLPALAADERVNLGRLTELRQSELHQRAAVLETRINELTGAEAELVTASAQIAGFDAVGYQRASQRVANRAAQERQQHDLGSAEEDVAEARQDQLVYQALMLSLACREAGDRAERARAGLAAADAELAHLRRNAWTRVRRFRAVSRAQTTRIDLLDEVAQATAALKTALEAARQANTTPESCGDRSRQAIEAGRDSATGRLKAAETQLADIRRELARLNALDLGGPADQARVTDEWPLWRLQTTLPSLQDRAEQERRHREPVEHEYQQLRAQITQERRALEERMVGEARVVATTLTQIAVRPWITSEPFDHVIIEEAATAQFPHLVHAVGLARVGAVLVGDYLQNRPQVAAEFPGGEQVKALFGRDGFAFLGATSPTEAKTRPGCVVLTEQFQVGSAITELANRAAYDNVLETAENGTADVVVVTVDGLPPALRTIHRTDRKQSGWWAIGSLLGRALTEYQGPGTRFGIVAENSAQVEATRAAVDEVGNGLLPVGTADSFQGRQFDTVLADLVADGAVTDPRDDDALDDVRRFTVAATRARSRLYLLLTDRALQNAAEGPLSELREMVAEGTAQHVDLLGLWDNSRDSRGGRWPSPAPEAELLAALNPYLRVVGPRDEDAIAEETVARITRATTSVWCWSAWVGKYAVAITDALEQAQRRGVDVHLLTRPLDQVPPGHQWSLAGLADRLPQVVFIRDMHQKLVIVDRRWSLIGSMNPISGPPAPRSFLITVESPAIAAQLLTQEKADELAQQRRCRQCDEPLRECRETGKEPKRRWIWLCPNSHPTPFPDGQQRSASRAHHRWAASSWTGITPRQ